MNSVYYEVIIKGNHKSGILYGPAHWPHRPIARDAEEVKDWESLVLTLKDGPYCPFNDCVGSANVVTEELKELIQSFVPQDYDVEFLPVKVKSEEYGDKLCYILHFTKIFDVIDRENTIYFEDTDVILKIRLDSEKCRNLHLFNTSPYVNDVVVSAELKNAIIRKHLDFGIEFSPIYCVK